jgi:hypothetical protein
MPDGSCVEPLITFAASVTSANASIPSSLELSADVKFISDNPPSTYSE